MNQYIRTSLGLAIIIIMTVTIGSLVWIYYQNNLVESVLLDKPLTVKNPPRQACTEEAKLCPDGVNSVGRTEANCEFAECPEIVGIADKLVIDSPAPGEIISSPIYVSGRARGGWFFEGSFPVEIYDENNKLLGTAPINFTPKSEQDTWMTTEFVDFSGELKFTQPKTEDGYLLFKKDNPSGKPELDESFRLSVKFANIDMSGWQTYRNEKYGFQLTLPEKWSTYSVEEGRDGMGYPFVAITVPDNSKPANMISMINIMFYDKKTWKPNQVDQIGMKAGENASYYFYYTPGLQDDIPGTEGMREMADDTINTLKAL